MKKTKFSLLEKKTLRMVIVLALIQMVIVFTFAHILIGSQQVNVNDTKQIDIIVDDIYYFRIPGENQLFVVADSKNYLFTSRSTFKENSVHNLYDTISKRERLSLTYYEAYNIILGQFNVVVDARSETETYRTFEEYNRAREGVSIFVVVLYSIIELIFGGVVFVYVWINCTTIKGIYKKTKNHLIKQKSNE